MSGSRSQAEISAEPELTSYLEELLGTGSGPSADSVETPPDSGPREPATEPLPPGCPEWLTPVFQVAILHLGKLRFAVPSCQIDDARRIEGAQPPESGTEPVLGRLETDGRTWLVVDTARLILAGKRHGSRYRWMVPVPRSGAALACDGVSESGPVPVAQVRWRQQRQSRPWLLGMLTGDPACPLLDAEALVADLQSDLTQSR